MLARKALAGTAGAPKVYVEDVFSTYLYTGNGSTQTITNGIDLSTKGGLVWIKSRAGTYVREHYLYDTARGTILTLSTDTTGANVNNSPNGVTAFNSDGFTALGPLGAGLTASGTTYASWTFREQPKFFDVVTYTGTGSNRTVAHNLGSVPGCIIVKRTDTAADWQVYHRSLANTEYLVLNSTAAKATGTTRWNSTTPTSTEFSLGTDTTVNASGGTYVAYLFAHDAGGFGLTGADNVISCGSFTSTGATPISINLGYEPQWILAKQTNATSGWYIFDVMRGMSYSADAYLSPNTSTAEGSTTGVVPTATGWDDSFWNSGNQVIYIAIRRGPMKTPTSGTSVFEPVAFTGNATSRTIGTITADSLLLRERASDTWNLSSRLTGNDSFLETNTTAIESSATSGTRPSFTKEQVGVVYNGATKNQSSTNYIDYLFRRAPGFFDVVCYTGDGGNPQAVSHNLGVAPDMVIVKRRTVSTANWIVGLSSTSTPYQDGLYLNTTDALISGDNEINGASTTTISVRNTLSNSGTAFIAYLFASLSGVSKIGTYTGNGSSVTVTTDFQPRFIMVKRTNSTGNWIVSDSARGLVAGSDPYLFINTTATEVTNEDWVDITSTSFTVNQTTANANVNTGTYIYLAIA